MNLGHAETPPFGYEFERQTTRSAVEAVPARRERIGVWARHPRDRFFRYATPEVSIVREGPVPQPGGRDAPRRRRSERAEPGRVHLVAIFLVIYGAAMGVLVLAQISRSAALLALVMLFVVGPVGVVVQRVWPARD